MIRLAAWVISFFLSLAIAADTDPKPLPGYPFDPAAEEEKYECLDYDARFEELGKLKVAPWYVHDLETFHYSVCVSKDFNYQQISLIRQAFDRFYFMLSYYGLYQCLNKHDPASFIDSPEDEARFRYHYRSKAFSVVYSGPKKVGGKPPQLNKEEIRKFYISALTNSETVKTDDLYVDGYPNFFNNPKYNRSEKEGKRYISVAVSKKWLGDLDLPLGPNIDFWAALIANSYFKNLGMAEQPEKIALNELSLVTNCVYWGNWTPDSYNPLTVKDAQ